MKTTLAALGSVSAVALALALSPVAIADDQPTALSESWAQANDSLGAGGSAANDRSIAVTTDDILVPLNGAAASDGAYAVHNLGLFADRGGTIDNDGFDLDLNVGDLVVELGVTTASLNGATVTPLSNQFGFATGDIFNLSLCNSDGINIVNANTGIASQATHLGVSSIVK